MRAVNAQKKADTSHDNQIGMAKDGWKFTRQGPDWSATPPPVPDQLKGKPEPDIFASDPQTRDAAMASVRKKLGIK